MTHVLSHLSPNDLVAMALVSRHFNQLVTTPHAWMVAFARYFPGPVALLEPSLGLDSEEDDGKTIRSERRSFTRLTALASWRSEYILRTRLLRCLVRGRPIQAPASASSSRAAPSQAVLPIVMYPARVFTVINHLHATFGSGLNKKAPRLIHGAIDVGMVTTSDPITGKVDPWGDSDGIFFSSFADNFPGAPQWGLGDGDSVGCPNVMDVSQPHGMIYGQGCLEGNVYYRSVEQKRGGYIAVPTDLSRPMAGMPNLAAHAGVVSSVWIAKTSAIPTLSDGLIGLMVGSSTGVVTACSLGNDGVRGHRLVPGETTARWVLSPGVPIVAIAVDEQYSASRQAQGRIWAVVLNALGEVFYLKKFPKWFQLQIPRKDMTCVEHMEYTAWISGRSVYWNLVEPSRRVARPDPYHEALTDGSYSPRSSWEGMGLSPDQIAAETREIEEFMRLPPKHFRKACLGWDMQRRLEVDFAGDDGHDAGEAIAVFECGIDEGNTAAIKRYTRWRMEEKREDGTRSTNTPTFEQPPPVSSLFGGGATASGSSSKPQHIRTSSHTSCASSPERKNFVEEWRCSQFSFGGLRNVLITATAIDGSTFATLTLTEDPALGFSTASTASSPYASPMSVASQPASPSDIPGQRARFVAVGTASGAVLVWNIRAPVPRNSTLTNTIEPLRIIYTESPEISSLGLTALYLVHGGNDGLVQAWDVLASTTLPVKTLNGRFSRRARSRLVQAQASTQGVGINMYAAGAIVLDPDPTSLRGVVALGNQIRVWSYSSSAADQYKGSKRSRLRNASERSTNHSGFSGSGRPNLKGYIENEKYELERDQAERRKHAELLAGRFGVDLLDNEDEALAYATLLSQEAAEAERRDKEIESGDGWATSGSTPLGLQSQVCQSQSHANGHDEYDADLAEAIRLSLQEQEQLQQPKRPPTPPSYLNTSIEYDTSTYIEPGSSELDDLPNVSIRYGKGRRSPTQGMGGVAVAESSREMEMSDLEFALQLSLAEEASRKESKGVGEKEEFPALSPGPSAGGSGAGKDKGKGKGKARTMSM